MNRYWLALVVGMFSSFASGYNFVDRANALVERAGFDSDELVYGRGGVVVDALYSKDGFVSGRVVTWPAAPEVPAPDFSVLAAISDVEISDAYSQRDARRAAKRQGAKSPSLKAAEKKLIQFLRDEGAIAAGAKSATAGEIDAMIANWEATLNDQQLDKKSTKYDRLLKSVERRGGTELDSYYHE